MKYKFFILVFSLVILNCKSRNSSSNIKNLSFESSKPTFLLGPDFLTIEDVGTNGLEFTALKDGYGDQTYFYWFTPSPSNQTIVKEELYRLAETELESKKARYNKKTEQVEVNPNEVQAYVVGEVFPPKLSLAGVFQTFADQSSNRGCMVYFKNHENITSMRYFMAKGTKLNISKVVLSPSVSEDGTFTAIITANGINDFASHGLTSDNLLYFQNNPTPKYDHSESYTHISRTTGPIMFTDLMQIKDKVSSRVQLPRKDLPHYQSPGLELYCKIDISSKEQIFKEIIPSLENIFGNTFKLESQMAPTLNGVNWDNKR